VNALAKPEVGKYLNENCVACYQKVGTFLLVGGNKQGGNVASYFTTPEGRVLHCVAGPVDAPTLLREARWAVEIWKLALLEGKSEKTARFRTVLAKAHRDRLQREHGARLPRFNLYADEVPPARIGALLDHHRGRGVASSNQGRVHLILATYPVPRLEQVYGVVFHKILNEDLSTLPVVQR
jgi:hypothetical protein